MQQPLGWESLLGALESAEVNLKNYSDPRTDALMAMDAVRFEIEAAKVQSESTQASVRVAAEERALEQQFFGLQIQMHQEEQAKLNEVIRNLREELQKALLKLSQMGARVSEAKRQAAAELAALAEAHHRANSENQRLATVEITKLKQELSAEKQRRREIIAYVNRI